MPDVLLKIESPGRRPGNFGSESHTAQPKGIKPGQLVSEAKSERKLPKILKTLRPGRQSGMPNGIPESLCRRKLNQKVMGSNQFERIGGKPVKITVIWRERQLRLPQVNGN